MTLNWTNWTNLSSIQANLKISCFTSTHDRTIHCKSLISLKLHLWKTAKNYSNQEIFNTAKLEYKDELKKSSYNVDLKYTNNKSEKLKTRKWNIIWLNSSFSKSVSTNVAKTFLQLVIKHFARSHNKIFNHNSVKVATVAWKICQKSSRDITKKSYLSHVIKVQLQKKSIMSIGRELSS